MALTVCQAFLIHKCFLMESLTILLWNPVSECSSRLISSKSFYYYFLFFSLVGLYIYWYQFVPTEGCNNEYDAVSVLRKLNHSDVMQCFILHFILGNVVWLDEMTATRALINMSSLPDLDKIRGRDANEDKSSEKSKKGNWTQRRDIGAESPVVYSVGLGFCSECCIASPHQSFLK